jgi:hypothetical protein
MFIRPRMTQANLTAARLGIVTVRYDAKGLPISRRIKRLWRYLADL